MGAQQLGNVKMAGPARLGEAPDAPKRADHVGAHPNLKQVPHRIHVPFCYGIEKPILEVQLGLERVNLRVALANPTAFQIVKVLGVAVDTHALSSAPRHRVQDKFDWAGSV